MRCAVIELNEYHDEVIPSLVHVLNSLGIEPDVYVPQVAIDRDPFVFASDLHFRLYPADGVRGVLGVPRFWRRYDLVVFNSLEPRPLLHRAARFAAPRLGIIHNAELIRDDPEYAAFAAAPGAGVLVLARHIANAPGLRGRVSWLAPVHFGAVPPAPWPPSPEPPPMRLAVQGNIEFSRRNYESLLTAASELAAVGAAPRITMIGRVESRDGRRLREDVGRLGLASLIEFTGEVSFRTYLGVLAASAYLLPLVDRTDSLYGPYFATKTTSSISMAVALGVPLIAHADLAACYGLRAGAITYLDGGLAAAIRTAETLDEAGRGRLVEELVRQRALWLAESATELSRAIDRVMAAGRQRNRG